MLSWCWKVVGGRDHGRQRRHGFGGVSAELWVESNTILDGPLAASFFERLTEVTERIDKQLTLIIVLNTGAGGLATAQALALLERPRALLEGGGHAEGALDVHLERFAPSLFGCRISRIRYRLHTIDILQIPKLVPFVNI